MKKLNKEIAMFLAISFGVIGFVSAATTINMGSLNNFAVVAGSTITNTGPTVINGDLGLSPGTSVTGFPPGTISGTTHIANTNSIQAQNDLVTAYNSSSQTPVITIPTELGGSTLTSGVYDSTSGTFGITGTLTLNAEGNPNAVFIFKTASTLITGGASRVVLINGAQACNVFWQVGSSATLGANSTFKGNLLVLTSATLTTGANVEGRVLARNGAVTLDTNTITRAVCAAPVVVITPTPTSTPVVVITTPTSTPVVITTTPTSTPVIISTPTFPNAGTDPMEATRNIALSVLGLTMMVMLAIVSRKKYLVLK